MAYMKNVIVFLILINTFSVKAQEVTYSVKGVEFTMVKIPAGEFRMGTSKEKDTEAEEQEMPSHRVVLSPYQIGKYEVTQELWVAVMGKNPSKWQDSHKPVEDISWYDCQKFIKKLNKLTGGSFRLPTEAEWEYAARGGNKSQDYKYSGSNNIDEVAWYGENSGKGPHKVGLKKSNEVGLYDMSGNIMEWCKDGERTYNGFWYDDPEGKLIKNFMCPCVRGGFWDLDAKDCRNTCRSAIGADYKSPGIGFRLAK